MVKVSRVSIGDYLAGGAIAFGIVLLVDQILSAYYGYSSFLGRSETMGDELFFIVSLHTMSGLLSGYIIGRRNVENSIQSPLIVAVMAYMFESIYVRLFVGSFGDVWALISLVIGGFIGSAFARIQMTKHLLQVQRKE